MNGTSWFGLLFLNLNQNSQASEFLERMDELRARLNRLGCYEGKLINVGSKVFPINCNWKVGLKPSVYHRSRYPIDNEMRCNA